MKINSVLILILFLWSSGLSGQEFSVLFYNVENLFDTVDDPLTDDDEFLPNGSRRWTPVRYRNKLNALARAVTAAAGGWEMPAVIGMCEVENEKVVKDLVYGTILSGAGYGIVHRESPDLRGIDPTLLYRRDLFEVVAVRSWLPESLDGLPVNTRNLLYTKLVADSDTLHIIVCHLPSKRGGVMAAAGLRRQMGELIKSKCDSIAEVSGGQAAVMVLGDFNAWPAEMPLTFLTGTGGLINMAVAATGTGSYKYQGKWEMLDQVLVSASMTDGAASFQVVPGSFRVAEVPFLLTDDLTYPGKKPFATYGGFRWSGGYSDHLPVLVTVRR